MECKNHIRTLIDTEEEKEVWFCFVKGKNGYWSFGLRDGDG